MAQLMVSWFICHGAIRVYAVNAVGRRSGRIIEIEDIDTGERVEAPAPIAPIFGQSHGAPAASWIESRQGHPTLPLEA
jgi:hypothetical protein